ncbi:MAG TPA: peptidoglycan DD-metalloendopeptidase family protein [Longimicrobiales bacterium]
MDDRRLTFIVVPHGDLETKTIEIPYRTLKLLVVLVLVVGLGLAVLVGAWWSIAAQAARVPELERQLRTFERERAKVDSLAHVLADVESQYQRVREMLGADAPAAGKQPLLPDLPKGATRDDNGDGVADASAPDAWPLTERGFITRGLTRMPGAHPGIDIAVPQNSYIRASGPGVVKTASEDSVYGKYIVIDHGGGMETVYAHASQLLVKQGTKVKRLQLIALSGSTGQSTAPHLHFEVRKGGKPVDPYQYVRQP